MEMLTVGQVANRLGRSESWVRREIGSGRMRATVRRGMTKGMRVSGEELDRWAREEWEPVAAGQELGRGGRP